MSLFEKRTVLATILGLLVTATSCQRPAPEAGLNAAPVPKPVLLGSGATFPAALYQNWAQTFTANEIKYDPIGSGGGVREFMTGKTDFGASDNALTKEERSYAKGEIVMIPATAGAIALAFNVPGLQRLNLSNGALIRIFEGRITQWNDPALANANPQLQLPALPIMPIHRLDSSGTTFVFLRHLAAASPNNRLGIGRTVAWPSGEGAYGNEGMGAKIKLTPGAIGYLQYGTARLLKLPMAAVENSAGAYIEPNLASSTNALLDLAQPEDMVGSTSPATAYPLVTYSWLVTHARWAEAAKAERLKGFLRYALTEGQGAAESLGYVPLPKAIVEQSLSLVETIHGP